jgi:hypothetical protein
MKTFVTSACAFSCTIFTFLLFSTTSWSQETTRWQEIQTLESPAPSFKNKPLQDDGKNTTPPPLPDQARCDNPTPIQCGSVLTNQVNTGVSQFNHMDYKMGCLDAAQGAAWASPEKLYSLTVTQQTSVHIVLDIVTGGRDLDIFLMTQCQPVFTCLGYSFEDNATTGPREMLDFNLTPGTYYVIVDGYGAADANTTFNLTVNCTCTCIEPPGDLPDGNILLCDNFQDYLPNRGLNGQSSRWREFKLNSSYQPEDARVEQSGTNRYGRFQATASNNEPDLMYNLDNKESGRYRISWKMRVENGKRGYFAMLHERPDNPAPPSGIVWAYEVFFRNDRRGEIRFGNLTVTPDVFQFPQGSWFNVVNIIDLEKDSVELFINNTFVYSWKFSLAYANNTQQPNLKRIGGLNFFAGFTNGNDFSIDDLCMWTTRPNCNGSGTNAICTTSGQRYGNEATARCQLYTSSEFDDCLTICDYGGTPIYRGDTFNGALSNSDIAAGFIKNDPCVRAAYGSNFPNPLFADIYIFYKTDNDVFSIGVNSNNPQVKKFVFSCRSNPNCGVAKQTCLTEIPNTGYSPASCDNAYYVAVTGPAGATYSINIIPTGACGSSFTEIACEASLSASFNNSSSDFSKSGGAYGSCYAGTRNYNGNQKIFRFYVPDQRRVIFTAEPVVSSSRIGMFLYPFLCGQQCASFAENANSGGKAILQQTLSSGVYYLVVDSESGSGANFKIDMDCQWTTTFGPPGDTSTCTLCGCFNKEMMPPPDPVIVNDSCSCKGTDRNTPHTVNIKISDSNLFASNDQIWFFYANELGEINSQLPYQQTWTVPPAGSTLPNASLSLGVDKAGDLRKCSFTTGENFQIYRVQNLLGRSNSWRLIPTYAAGTNMFAPNGNSFINSLRQDGSLVHFSVDVPPYETPSNASDRINNTVSSSGPWTMRKLPAPGYTDVSWLQVIAPPPNTTTVRLTADGGLSGQGAGSETFTLRHSPNTSPYPREILLEFTYTRNTAFKRIVKVRQQGICVPANVTLEATPGPYCAGNTVTLSANVGSYNGEALANLYNYAWNGGAATSSIAEILATSQTYTVTVTNKYNYCPNSANATRTITVSPRPTPNITGKTEECTGKSVTLTASGGGTYQWSGGGGTANTVTFTVNNPTTYTVTVTNAGGCSATAARTVSPLTPPNAAIALAGSVCPNQSVTLTATGGGTYLWSNSGGTGATATFTPAATTTYTVTVTGANSCTSTATREVIVSGSIMPTITAPAQVCPGSNAALTASGPAGATYSWSNGATTSSISPTVNANTTYSVTVTAGGCSGSATASVATRPSVNVTTSKTDAACGQPTGTASASASGGSGGFQFSWSNGQNTSSISGLPAGTYSVVVTDAAGCSAVSSITVGNSNGPTANVATPATICPSGQTTLNAGVTGGTQPYSYAWSNTQTSPSVTVAPSGGTTYTVTVRDANSCTSVAQVSIPVHPAPTVNITGNSATCPNVPLTLTGIGGTQYQWNYNGNNANGNTINITTASPVTVNLTATDANGCTGTAVRTIAVNPQPVAAISGNSSVCAGNSTVLTASGGASYSWSSGQNSAVAVLNPTTNTTYTVTVTSEQGCTAIATQAVTVNPLPVAAISGTMSVCAGASAGLTATGGTAYSWSTGQNGANITVNPGGNTTYTVTVFNGSCSNTATATVSILPSPTAQIGGNTVICAGTPTTLTAFGGGTYQWNTGSNNSFINVSPTANTTYTVTVTNGSGCSNTTATAVTVRPATIATINKTDATCGLSNGSATVSLSGGTGPFSFNWNTGATTISINGLSAATYNVTTTDANGCTSIAGTNIGNSNGPSASVTGGQVVCQGTTIQMNAVVSGGTTPYIYTWSNGSTNLTLTVTPSLSGNYTVTVRDVNGCTVQAQASVTVNPLPLAGIVGNSTACTGGIATLEATGGIGYAWNTGASTAAISPTINAPATFTVTVTNAGGCTATASRSISVTTPPVVRIVGNNSVCPGNATVLTATGAIAYNWSTGASNPVVPVQPTTATTYSVTGTDANGCTATASIDISLRTVPAISINKTDAACGQPTGSATAVLTGGTGPFIFTWSNGGSNPTISNLSAGSYGVTVLDGNGCTVSSSASVGNSNGPTVGINAVSMAVCAGQTANLQTTVTGGAQPYQYNWSNNQTGNAINPTPAATTIYTVTVRDQGGCTAAAQVQIIVNPLPTPAISGNSSICIGNDITLSVTGGNTFVWSTGTTGNSLTQAPAGNTTYRVTATDANGCTATAERAILVNPLPIARIQGPIAVCSGQSFQLTASGGGSYLWNDGSTAATVSATLLSSGTFTVTVTALAGCSATATNAVAVNAVPNAQTTSTDAACGQSNGSAVTTVTGGATPYSYLWNTGATAASLGNLSAGVFTVTVRDVNGCTSVNTVNVRNVNGPTASAGGNISVCSGGSVILNAIASGGTPPYQYTWSSGATTDALPVTPTATGSYTVTIRDAGNCSAVASVLVTVNPLPPVNVSGSTAICGGQAATLTASGGQSYMWNTGATTTTIQATTAGLYVVTATGQNSCMATASTQLTLFPGITAQANVVSPIRCFGESNGILSVLPGGGTPPFTVVWSNGQSQPQIGGLGAGTYTAVVSDQAGCSVTTNAITLTEPTEIVLTNQVIQNDNNNSGQGSVSVNISGGVLPYRYVWSRDNFQVPGSTATLTGLMSGQYSLRLTDANNCARTFGPFVVDNIVGTRDPVWASDLRIFPNPGTGVFYLQLQGNIAIRTDRISLYDVLGREVYASKGKELSNTPTEMNVEYLPSGAYLMKIQVGSDLTSQKVWIQK